MTKKFSQVAHLYLGCEVEVDNYYHELYYKNNKAFLIGIYGSLCYVDFYEILANGVECCVTDDSLKLSHEEIKPRLYSLADITEEHTKELVKLKTQSESFDSFKIIRHFVNGEGFIYEYTLSELNRKVTDRIYFNELTSDQFTQLLQWGYWLFGYEAFETGEIIKKQK